MTLCRRAARFGLLFLLLPLLAGCGWRPVYGGRGGDDSVVAAALNTVSIDNISDRVGQQMRNDLIDKMYLHGRPTDIQYHLVVVAKPVEQDLGILLDSTSVRSQIDMYADYTLLDKDKKVVIKGKVHSISSFNTLNDEYGNLAAQQGAIERTADEAAEQIVNRLSLYFGEKDVAPPVDAEEQPDMPQPSGPLYRTVPVR